MPIYTYECPSGHVEDRIRCMADTRSVKCATCRKKMKRVLKPPQVIVKNPAAGPRRSR